MQYTNVLLALSSLTTLISSTPLTTSKTPSLSNTLFKRTDPDTEVDDAWPSEAALEKVEDAFKAVIELSSYVMTEDINNNDDDAIWRHYFGAGDQAKVKAVFNAIMGNPSDPANPDPTGSSLLGNIFVQKSDPDGVCAGGNTNAVMTDWHADKPIIVICDLGLAQKALWDVECEDLGPNVSYKFMTLAGTMLHEYTHWSTLTSSIVGGDGVVDHAYGVWEAWNLASTNTAQAITNADNYAYYASHVFYEVICSGHYGAPVENVDDADPSCGNSPCHE